MTTDREAVARCAEDVGEALLRLAARLRAGSEAETAASTHPGPEAGAGPRRRRRGGAQRALIASLREHQEEGATAATLAEETGQKQPNVLRALRGLAEEGVVASDGARPAVWRMVVKARQSDAGASAAE